MRKDILIGVDSGTSVVKSVAFDLTGQQLASASVPNRYLQLPDGTASQPLAQTWDDCVTTLRELGEKIQDLAQRTAAMAVTGQGDGTWLVGKNDVPVGDAWLWLDSRSAPTVQQMRGTADDLLRFEKTGSGLNSCQQGTQLAHMQSAIPEFLQGVETAFHCKDWLYLKLTGERVTDPSEATFTFGNFRTRQYDDDVIALLGLAGKRSLLPPIIDGSKDTHSLSADASRQTGLLQGTPVSLGFVDVVCTAMGAGIYTQGVDAGCSIIGSTGMHMRVVADRDVTLNPNRTGYVMVLPVPGIVSQAQSNMAATLNIDWILGMVSELLTDLGSELSKSQLLDKVAHWASLSKPGSLLYHPYISEAGERGPFVNNTARAGFTGLNTSHRFPDMLRAVLEGLGMAANDCYCAMGDKPAEIRLTGGAARSDVMREILSASIDTPVRYSSRGEAGAAGAAMMAAVALGAFDSMDACVDTWVTPLLSELELPDPGLAQTYRNLFPEYLAIREALEPVWNSMARLQERQS